MRGISVAGLGICSVALGFVSLILFQTTEVGENPEEDDQV
jgi:hypothetical protein